MAFVCANTPLESYYALLLDTPVEFRIGALELAKPLLLWINDGLMAVFFFLVGLELKRELIEGELSDRRNIILPGVGAIGGMVAPAIIYISFNTGDTAAMAGWAIPAATDIAFALGSGVHATLAGVVLAMFIPMRSKTNDTYSPLKSMEQDVHSAVAFLVLPIFAFANAGISFSGVGAEQIFQSVPMGIALGLFIGKQVGIFGICWVAIKFGFTKLPPSMSWGSLYGTAATLGDQ